MTQHPAQRMLHELPFTPRGELPEPLKQHIEEMISTQQLSPAAPFEVLTVSGSLAERKRSYYIALLTSWAILLGSLAAAIAVGRSTAWASGVMVLFMGGSIGLVSMWLWAGKRRELVRDQFFEMGLVTEDLLLCRDLGTFRIVPLDGIVQTHVEVRREGGMIADICLVLSRNEDELRWIGLTAYTPEQVAEFSQTINRLLGQKSQTRHS